MEKFWCTPVRTHQGQGWNLRSSKNSREQTVREFYIGYLPKAPTLIARTLRITIACMAAGAALFGLLLVVSQAPFPATTFEFHEYRAFEGRIEEYPYPVLVKSDRSRFLLAAPGKHGASDLVAGMDNQILHAQGSRIYRGGDVMLELRPGSLNITHASSTPASPVPVDLGLLTLSGEIVDSKCYLGVMNPGSGKVHRDCAARCISGGLPPALVAKDSASAPRLLLLAGSDGRALNREVLAFVGEPIRVSGRLLHLGNSFYLRAEPRDFRRE
jgi:hypothetical protein